MEALDTALFKITAEQVEEIILDLKLQSEGFRLYYTVDPHDIYDFCFPTLRADATEREINHIADDQIALYELFFRSAIPPILLHLYADEVARILDFVDRSANAGFMKLETVNRIIKRSQPGEPNTELANYVSRHFNVLLAAMMGAFSLGAERFDAVLKRVKGAAAKIVHADAIARIFAEYEPSLLREEIFEALTRDARQPNSLDRSRAIRSADVDSAIIDFLMSVNGRLEKASRGSDLKVLFLYFSSAPRSRRVFALETVKANFPDVLGRRFSFLRSRAQMFAYTVYKVMQPSGDAIDIPATITNLEAFASALRSIQDMNDALRDVETAHPTVRQELSDLLKDMRQRIEERRKEAANLGLLSNIAEYESLTVKAGGDFGVVTETFRKVYERFAYGKDQSLEGMHVALSLMSTQADFSKDMVLNSVPNEADLRREGRDIVTGAMQYLPVLPQVQSQDYRDIMNEVIEFYKLPLQKMNSRIRTLLEAYKKFMEVDSTIKGGDNADHELVRCFLYLSFLKADGDQKAWRHSKDMIRKFSKTAQEFRYVNCWAARRTRQFPESWEVASKGIAQNRSDARFYHGRALAAFAWLNDADRSGPCPHGLSSIIEDMETVLNLYRNSKEDRQEMIGVALNDLTYLYSWREEFPSYDLTKARRNLDLLKTYVPEDRWDPLYPEYFHTEAHLLFKEAHQFTGTANRKAKLDSLQQAKERIGHAIRLMPKGNYRVLLTSIEQEEDVELAAAREAGVG